MGVGLIITSTGGSGLSVSYVGLLAAKIVWKYSSPKKNVMTVMTRFMTLLNFPPHPSNATS